jgi:DNA-binding Lrp family transcriptional regulator
MRLSEALDGVGRPVAYFPALAKCLGGVKAVILFCQLFYWSQQKPGEFWKSQEELADETGLTIQELRAARKELAEKGIVQTRYARIEHRLYFKIDRKRLDALWARRNGHLLNSQVPPWEIPDGDVRKSDLDRSDPEITTEITNREGERDSSRTPAPASKNGHRKPKTPWPENLELTPEMAAYAETQGIDGEAEFKAWRVYCLANDRRYADWNAAWPDWLNKAPRFGKNGKAEAPRLSPGHQRLVDAIQRERAREAGSGASDSSPYQTGAGERLKREQEAIAREDAARTPEEREAARQEVSRIVNRVVHPEVVEPRARRRRLSNGMQQLADLYEDASRREAIASDRSAADKGESR